MKCVVFLNGAEEFTETTLQGHSTGDHTQSVLTQYLLNFCKISHP